MEEHETVGRIAELEEENAWLKGRIEEVWRFLLYASKGKAGGSLGAKRFLDDLRKAHHDRHAERRGLGNRCP